MAWHSHLLITSTWAQDWDLTLSIITQCHHALSSAHNVHKHISLWIPVKSTSHLSSIIHTHQAGLQPVRPPWLRMIGDLTDSTTLVFCLFNISTVLIHSQTHGCRIYLGLSKDLCNTQIGQSLLSLTAQRACHNKSQIFFSLFLFVICTGWSHDWLHSIFDSTSVSLRVSCETGPESMLWSVQLPL